MSASSGPAATAASGSFGSRLGTSTTNATATATATTATPTDESKPTTGPVAAIAHKRRRDQQSAARPDWLAASFDITAISASASASTSANTTTATKRRRFAKPHDGPAEWARHARRVVVVAHAIGPATEPDELGPNGRPSALKCWPKTIRLTN